jgi:ethanolaminephosphotransferase
MNFLFFTLGNVLLLVSLFFFTSGFLSSELFPKGNSAYADTHKYDRELRADPVFDRVVFLLVDALRPDFVYGRQSGFEFTQRHGVFNIKFGSIFC